MSPGNGPRGATGEAREPLAGQPNQTDLRPGDVSESWQSCARAPMRLAASATRTTTPPPPNADFTCT